MLRQHHSGDFLRRLAPFAGCTDRQYFEIERLTTRLFVPAGVTLVHEAAVARECFIIVEGTATVRRHGAEVARVGVGDFVGEVGVIRRAVRNATVIALSDMTVLVMTPQELSSLLVLLPTLAERLEALVAEREVVDAAR